MQIPIDREKYAEVSGVSFNKDKTVTLQGPALVPSDSGYVAPQLVPDGVSAATHELERGEAERLYADMSSFVEGFGGSSSKSSGAFTFTIPTQSLDDVTSVYEGLNSVPAVSVNQSGADYTQFTLSASQMNQERAHSEWTWSLPPPCNKSLRAAAQRQSIFGPIL